MPNLPLRSSWPSEVLLHISTLNRSLHTLMMQVEDCLPDPQFDAYYDAIQDAYMAMKALQVRTEWFVDLEKARGKKDG